MSIIYQLFLENLMCFSVIFFNHPRRKYFAPRFLALSILSALVLRLFSAFCPVTGAGLLPVIYLLVEFGVLTVLFHACFQTDWEESFFFACTGRAIQHLIHSVLNLIQLKTGQLLPFLTGGMWLGLLRQFLLYLPFCLVLYFAFAKKKRSFRNKTDHFHGHMGMLSAVILFICIGMPRLVNGVEDWNQSAFIAQNLYAIVCCSLCVFMEIQLASDVQLTMEIDMIRMLWKEDGKRLAERKETIELINMKCHDIRHKLEDYHLPVTHEEEIELSSLINIYDQSYNTGNQTLDVLLVDRTLWCEENHIQLSFMGNGGCLSFLSEGEVYSLFGNALDNAIKASCEVEEEKRQISLIIQSSGNLVSINMANYYRGDLHFEDGLPITTRPDPLDLHGYGMKSIRNISRKYGGELEVKAADGIFALTIWLINNGKQK